MRTSVTSQRSSPCRERAGDGAVTSAQPLIDVVPLQQKGIGQEVVTQLGMNDVVDMGLLKMDFLGLRNLDVIDKAVDLIGQGVSVEVDAADVKPY